MNSMIKKYMGIHIVLFLLTSATHAQSEQDSDSSYLSLQSLVEQVEQTYPDVVKFNDKIQAFEAKAEGARAWMSPTFSSGITRFPYSLSGMNEMTPMNQAGLMFSFNQMIINPTKLNTKTDYYKSLTEVELQKAQWTKNELRMLARKLYYQRYVAEKKLIVIQESEDLLTLFISTAESRYTYNQSSLGNIYKAKAKLEEIKNMRLMEESMIAESDIGINTLLNRELSTTFSIDTSIALKEYSAIFSPDTIQRSDIAVMQKMIESMQIEKKYMASQRLPDFGMEIQHMQMFGMPEQFSVMGMITIPIVPWSSKMYKSDVKAMQFEIQYVEKEIEGMQLMATRMATEKLVMLSYTKEQMINYETSIIPAFEKTFDANLLAFRQNTGDFFVLLDAWEMLLMKKMELLNLRLKSFYQQTDYEYEMEILE
jgi:outer membrane protein, heavy metal efflux system